MDSNLKMIIYTDGSYRQKGHNGGWSYAYYRNDNIKPILAYGHYNNAKGPAEMELVACIKALSFIGIDESIDIEIHTDCIRIYEMLKEQNIKGCNIDDLLQKYAGLDEKNFKACYDLVSLLKNMNNSITFIRTCKGSAFKRIVHRNAKLGLDHKDMLESNYYIKDLYHDQIELIEENTETSRQKDNL